MTGIEHKTKQRPLHSLALLVICLLTGIQSLFAQSGKVILPLREMTIKQAMDELQRQTAYKVAVNWDDLDPGRKVFYMTPFTIRYLRLALWKASLAITGQS